MWSRFPFILRTFLAAIAVTGTASLIWGALIQSNLRFSPQLPWAAVLMAVFLFFDWKLLKGWGWPQSTSAARRASLGAHPLSPSVWRWSLLAGGLGLDASIALFIFSRRLILWPHPPRPNLSPIPSYTLLPSLLVSATVAGISEEAGFRGHLQGPLSRRYGPAIGIAVTSFVFGLAHLSHGAFVPAILFDIGWGALYGLLTYLCGSILPAIFLHSTAGALEVLAALKFSPATPAPVLWASGPNSSFWFLSVLLILLGTASVWAFRHPVSVKAHQSTDALQLLRVDS